MGQGQRRRTRFFEQHPICCFCGGDTAATEIDHIPSIQMFIGRQRPKGLEMPACSECNRATRVDEQVAAMLARSWPPAATVAETKEIEQIMRGVANNNLPLMQELMPGAEQYKQLRRAGLDPAQHSFFDVSGPLVNQSIRRFGYKVTCALYYEVARMIAPAPAGIMVSWYTNFSRLTNDMPDMLFKYLGPAETLRQGRRNVGDQFQYSWAVAEGKRVAQLFASFRHSFCVNGFIHHDAGFFKRRGGDVHVFRPHTWRHS